MSLRIHWQEGLFLQPHHLQRMQKSLEDLVASERQLTWPYPYGVIEARLDREALGAKRVRFDKLRAVMPSGLEVNYPASAELPSLDIAQAFSKSSGGFTIFLGAPLWQNNRANTVPLSQDSESRVKLLYRVNEIECYDENTGENPKPVQIRKLNTRLMFEQEDMSDMEVLPLLRVVRATGDSLGMPAEDRDYVPPSMVLNGSPVLSEMVRDLVNQTMTARGSLAVRLMQAGFSLAEMRGDQVADLMRLRTLNQYSARLVSLIEAPVVSPFEIYMELRGLLSELAALRPARDDFDCPSYQHENQFLCFRELANKIYPMLVGGEAPSFRKLPFKDVGGVLTANFAPEDLTQPTAYYLAIRTKVEPTPLTKYVEDGDKFKLMPRSLIDRAVRGIELKEQRVAPMGLPVSDEGVELRYYRLERANSARMWERIQSERAAAVRWVGREVEFSPDDRFTLYMPVLAGGSK